ncbi:MAG: hypothetical protein HGA45_01845 [Chloroflexales bacterium]|nr:hypothetical protein [Chloroflexales bacterium]
MKPLPLVILLAVCGAALLVPLAPPLARAQLEATPILGEPVVVTPLATTVAQPEPSAAPSLTPTSSGGHGASASSSERAPAEPDVCEPNDTPARACALPLDTVSGPFTIVPEADQDFYRLDLPQEASIQTVITARATAGLELVLSARQGETLVASGTFSLTLAPSVAGPVILRVENRDPRPAAGEQYRVEVRREIIPPSQAAAATDDQATPDGLENNWSFETAATIAVGVVYDLSLVCPDPRPNACPGGDHDYLLVPVKAGVRYLITTFDLDPGVDTVVELFWGSTTAVAAGNDDYAPGGQLSALAWTAPADGLLGLRIAPRNGGLPLHLHATKAGYRFAVAPLAGELARKLEATIRQQANVPSPTPTPAAAAAATSGGSGAAGTGVTTPESIAAGPAIIVTKTVLRREPSERAAALATLAPETRVALRGPVSGLWVSVETSASILPGWVQASDLQRATEAATGAAPGLSSSTATSSAQPPGGAAQPGAPTTTSAAGAAGAVPALTRQVVVTALDPALPPPPSPPVARVPFALTVTVAATDRPPMGGGTLGFATPTPDLRHPIPGVRVQLVNVFGDVLAEGLTSAQGAVALSRDVRPGDALLVRIPAWGVELLLAAEQSSLIVTIPEGK